MTREYKDSLKEPEQNNVALAIFQKVELISFHPKQGFDFKKCSQSKGESQFTVEKQKTQD